MKIKVIIFMISISILLLVSCSLNDDNNSVNKDIVITQWNLINVTGGIAGVDHNFETGDILWRFNDLDGVLLVSNKNTDDTLEDGLSNGSFNHLYTELDSKTYLSVGNIEFGLITISENKEEFTLDQNKLISGDATDGFIYTFKKSTTVIN